MFYYSKEVNRVDATSINFSAKYKQNSKLVRNLRTNWYGTAAW